MTEQKPEENIVVNYSINSEIAGDKRNTNVPILEAARDIFKHVKEKAMQCAIKGEFIQFDNVDELKEKLSFAVKSGFTIHCYDEDLGG